MEIVSTYSKYEFTAEEEKELLGALTFEQLAFFETQYVTFLEQKAALLFDPQNPLSQAIEAAKLDGKLEFLSVFVSLLRQYQSFNQAQEK